MNSEEDTFNKLRRCSYEEACAAYTMAFINRYGNISIEDIDREVKSCGWTYESLLEESRRRDGIDIYT